jgi:hypothetical protein
MPATCKDCNIIYDAFDHMVIIHDKLWLELADNKEDCICDKCIEKRLGRKLTLDDFKKSNEPNLLDGSNMILCNMFWAKNKNLI